MKNLASEIRTCTNCSLFFNQLPLVQECSKADIFWIGLSAVKANSLIDLPLSSYTNSGKLIREIENYFSTISFYHSNLVKCLPLNSGKIRYPVLNEMKACYFNMLDELDYLRPKIIFLLGKQVSSFMTSQFCSEKVQFDEEFNFRVINHGSSIYVPIHHPSYILVYKRKKVHQYINAIVNLISQTLDIIPTHQENNISTEIFTGNYEQIKIDFFDV